MGIKEKNFKKHHSVLPASWSMSLFEAPIARLNTRLRMCRVLGRRTLVVVFIFSHCSPVLLWAMHWFTVCPLPLHLDFFLSWVNMLCLAHCKRKPFLTSLPVCSYSQSCLSKELPTHPSALSHHPSSSVHSRKISDAESAFLALL